ncbi:hypothetical protein GCM10020220_005780 [Nonomuraea rubra]
MPVEAWAADAGSAAAPSSPATPVSKDRRSTFDPLSEPVINGVPSTSAHAELAPPGGPGPELPFVRNAESLPKTLKFRQ